MTVFFFKRKTADEMRISDWSSDVCSSDLTAKLVARTAHPRVIGIGETGLDYHYDKSDRARQRDSFRRHIHASQQTGLPIIVHSRDAEADTQIGRAHV